jgi:hypothetical protein
MGSPEVWSASPCFSPPLPWPLARRALPAVPPQSSAVATILPVLCHHGRRLHLCRRRTRAERKGKEELAPRRRHGRHVLPAIGPPPLPTKKSRAALLSSSSVLAAAAPTDGGGRDPELAEPLEPRPPQPELAEIPSWPIRGRHRFPGWSSPRGDKRSPGYHGRSSPWGGAAEERGKDWGKIER